MQRITTSFVSSGLRCDAWLFRPDTAGPHPAVVLAHGSVGVKEAGLDRYGRRFAEAGFTALAFDYRHFGRSEGTPRQLASLRRMREDVRAALAFVREQPDVDADRVALWGTSMGAGHVATVAAEDDGLASAIVQCPVMDGLAIARRYGPRRMARVAPDIAADGVRRLLGREPRYIPMVAPPGEKAMMSAPGHFEQVMRLVADAEGSFVNRMSAWVLNELVSERPIRRLAKARCPVLVCSVDREDIVDPAAVRAAARRAPAAELRRYGSDHFDLYFEPLVQQVLDDQVEFLARHLGAGAAEHRGGEPPVAVCAEAAATGRAA
jgi:alpha-beta hydrolase superfamily lysophospholipase